MVWNLLLPVSGSGLLSLMLMRVARKASGAQIGTVAVISERNSQLWRGLWRPGQ